MRNFILKSILPAAVRLGTAASIDSTRIISRFKHVDISGLKKAEVLAGLYNASKPVGMGFMHYTQEDMTPEKAAEIIESQGTSFDYLNGRVMKVDISGDVVEDSMYDRDNGPDALKSVVEHLRAGAKVSSEQHLPKRGDEVTADKIKNTMVILKNGTQAPLLKVLSSFDIFNSLFNGEIKGVPHITGVLMLYELRELCKNPGHEVFTSDMESKLKELSLINKDGSVDPTVKNIVESTLIGDGASFSMQNPLATSLDSNVTVEPLECERRRQ